MLRKSLHIYTVTAEGSTMPFPSAQEPAVLSEWGYTAERMAGAPTITGSLMHSMCLDDLWSKREYVEFNGERYFVDQIPTSSKNTDDARYSHEITLTSERIVLENVYFFDVVTSETEAQYKDRYRSNGTTFSFYGTLQELVARLNDSLIYTKLYDVATNKGYQVIIDEGVSITEEKEISLENVYFATALQEIYTKFEVPYYWVGTTCHVGYAENSITIPFEYGLGNGLLSVTKTNENYRIINRITGVGSSDNIPYYYPNTNPEGTAIFETVNIDKEKVRDIFLSKVLQYNTDIYPSTYTLTYNPPKFSFSLSLAKDGFAIYSAKTYYEEDVNDIEKRFVAEGSVLITILVHLTSGTVLEDYLMTATAGTKDPRTVRIDKSSYQTVITEYRYFDDDTYFGRLKPISSSYTITEEDNYLVGVKLDYKISRRLYKEDIGDPADYLTVSAGGFLNVIYKPNGFTGYGFRYGNGSVMPYEDGGIYLHDVQNAPCTRYKYELKKEDINPQYSKYSVETLIDEASSSDYPAQVIIIDRTWVTPTSALMPPIYRESNGGERFYNAQNNTYDNPDGGKYIFSNPYTESNPLEGIQNFEDIKPSIKGMKNSMGQLLGEIADIAFDSDDSDEIDDNGDYVHSYFYVKLHVYNGTYGFNLFKQATASGAMTFNMTSGNCAPCAFEVGVSQPKLVEGHYEFENPVQVDENGDIVSGSYNDKVNFNNIQPRQQDTSVYEVWVALKKEIDTFGVVMPNVTNNYKPSVGDTFVITNILMPDVYITNAENELKNALIKYMSENNDEKFSFNITLSRIYLQRNSDIVSMLNENARLIVRYNEHDYTLYVSSYSCKATDDILYEITVDVTSEFSVGQSMLRDKIAEVTHEVIGGGRAALDYLALAQKHFLSKRQRDRAKHKITFEEGVDFGDYVPAVQGGFIDGKGNAELLTLVVRDLLRSPVFRDGFGGEGWQIWMEDALSHLTIDKLTVRQVMNVFELLIMKVRSVGGQIAVSAANGKIKSVARQGDVYFISFENGCDFVKNDLMRCATWKDGKEQHAYWVEIAGVVADRAWVLASEFEGVEPMAGDECVLMGNTGNPMRQNMILISATEDGQPRIDVMDGISGKSFEGCLRARLGNLDGIKDSWFPADNQPHGDGLYADNAYLKGTFLLATGEDIKTKFEVVEGMISSAVESVRQDFAESEGFLSNPLFADGFNHWSAESDTGFLAVGNSWIWANGGILSKQGDGAVLSVDRDRTVVNIRNTSIIQRAADYYALPEIETNAAGRKEPASVYLSFLYKVRKAGTLSVHFDGLDKTGFENFSPLAVEEELSETEGYRQYTCSGLWNGTGDFTLGFTGEISVCMIVLTTDDVAALTAKYSTLVEQTDTVVRIVAQNFDKNGNVLAGSEIITTSKYNMLISERFNEDGSIRNTSGLVTTAEGSGIYAQGADGKIALIGVAVEDYDDDGNPKSVIKLTADHIQLEGIVTANDNFKILEDGSIETQNGKFTGEIAASSGRIGYFSIDEEGLYYGKPSMWHDDSYKQDLAHITPGTVKLQAQYGEFKPGDVANIKAAIGDGADPSIEDIFAAKACCAGYFYRQMNAVAPYDYHPAVKIISDNVISRDVALYTKGAIVCQGGLWGAACLMDTANYDIIEPAYGATVLIKNTNGGKNVYMPKLANMKRMMQTDGVFAVPIRLVSLNENRPTNIFFRSGESKTNFIRATGDSQAFLQLSACNTVDVLLVYNGTDDFYAIVK